MQRRQFLSAIDTLGTLGGASFAGAAFNVLAQRTPDVKELKPGTRIVSHAFDMGDWKPEKTGQVGSSSIYLWRIPLRS